ncbi:PspC domain-containing protein [Spiractinospora alimapuensis]|nr:PspC domain-containing protein [Spiractinospora alimapuensis]
MYRSVDDRLVAGVGAGLAEHLGLEKNIVRLALLVLAIGGVGIAIYIALVVFVPPALHAPATSDDASAESDEARAARATSTRSTGRRIAQVLAFAAVALIGWILLGALGGIVDPLLWFIVFGMLGVAVLWYQANPAQRDTWVGTPGLTGRRNLLRIAAGVALIVIGVVGFLAFRQEISEARQGLSATFAVLCGIAMVAAPWILSLVRERDLERKERIRSQERADIAAHIHDSVLQTLALIQRKSDDPREVQRLARVQERALRSWLYGSAATAATTVAVGMERMAADVEQEHGVPIEVVCVGDADIDDTLRPVVNAAREAVVNAAKYAGVGSISVYCEVEPEEMLVFVRDRGAGFDLESIPADRMGVRGSIIGRMERHGGSARIRTAPGEGTEVQLRMPRTAAG